MNRYQHHCARCKRHGQKLVRVSRRTTGRQQNYCERCFETVVRKGRDLEVIERL